MVRKKLKNVGVFSFAKFQAVLGGLVGFLCGIVYSFGGLIIDVLVSAGFLSAEKMSTPGLSYGTVLAFGALIGMPVIMAASGFVLGILEALLFNFYARWFGGINVEFE